MTSTWPSAPPKKPVTKEDIRKAKRDLNLNAGTGPDELMDEDGANDILIGMAAHPDTGEMHVTLAVDCEEAGVLLFRRMTPERTAALILMLDKAATIAQNLNNGEPPQGRFLPPGGIGLKDD